METYFYNQNTKSLLSKGGINYDGDLQKDSRILFADKLWRIAYVEHHPEYNKRRVFLDPKKNGEFW